MFWFVLDWIELLNFMGWRFSWFCLHDLDSWRCLVCSSVKKQAGYVYLPVVDNYRLLRVSLFFFFGADGGWSSGWRPPLQMMEQTSCVCRFLCKRHKVSSLMLMVFCFGDLCLRAVSYSIALGSCVAAITFWDLPWDIHPIPFIYFSVDWFRPRTTYDLFFLLRKLTNEHLICFCNLFYLNSFFNCFDPWLSWLNEIFGLIDGYYLMSWAMGHISICTFSPLELLLQSQ